MIKRPDDRLGREETLQLEVNDVLPEPFVVAFENKGHEVVFLLKGFFGAILQPALETR